MIIHHLENSRSFRIVWLLEELVEAGKLSHDDYQLEYYKRVNGRGSEQRLKDSHAMGKAPFLEDGDLTLIESGAIAQYLAEKYSAFLPQAQRYQVMSWVNYAEGTVFMHTIPCIYARWFLKDEATEKQFEHDLQGNLVKDIDYVASQLKGQDYFAGKDLTIADCMMEFSLNYVFKRKVCGLETSEKALTNGRWPSIDQWHARVAARPAYQRAAASPPDSYSV